ncbi:hypothetical protein M405DRAFT_188184 [Rhizopogon salebrosus TDB-379]|nr:hypothetical protein M405DRAFT_188184 [Rhizopogon salebrosus TDB-379]
MFGSSHWRNFDHWVTSVSMCHDLHTIQSSPFMTLYSPWTIYRYGTSSTSPSQDHLSLPFELRSIRILTFCYSSSTFHYEVLPARGRLFNTSSRQYMPTACKLGTRLAWNPGRSN